MSHAFSVRGTLLGAALTVGAASIGGIGLAAYATGGELGGIIQRESAPTVLSANSSALTPDSFETPGAIAMSPASGPYMCEGCGPTLEDRRAFAAARAYEEALIADEARFAALSAEPVPEPASDRASQSVAVMQDMPVVEPMREANAGLQLTVLDTH